MIDILLGSHDHLEGWDEFTASRTVPRHTEQTDGLKKMCSFRVRTTGSNIVEVIHESVLYSESKLYRTTSVV